MAKKRKVSKKKVSVAIILLLALAAGILGGMLFLKDKKSEDKTVKVKSVDTIEGYDYTLSSNATKYYKGLFKDLKKLLESGDVDKDKYADLVAKLFVADFYNLDNKINKNDIGGVQFVYKDFRADFKKIAGDSIYKSVQNNLYNNRKQELPIVTNVSVEKKDGNSFKYKDKELDAYVISFEISYQEDLGYQTIGVLTLVDNDKKIEVAALDDKE